MSSQGLNEQLILHLQSTSETHYISSWKKQHEMQHCMENVWSIIQAGTIEIHTHYLGSLNITSSNATDKICFSYYNT